ncbi:MAG: tRNA dihydrouridine(20/20a) synthase DusA [Natronospirillum sp.]|uniref:tRNA dihydrouridine(20/20a) synthase DusA n=1 Tax=Natronospirillum sp. TaxID=2812955 RepID=UPI0025EC29C2|nr:tRNA dihydrouridine(20/20a) synthase DusA [Natronospirillum sp.]MCH8553446.1 tRNA dihydrouridine(20/20a) synthase DusA [Natronospirillum sp.]
MPKRIDHRFCTAPMMDWTDRHCRYFWRLLSHHTVLYTEMVTTGALLHADPARFLRFDPAESPVGLQLGGSEPADLAHCARLAEQWGYDEVNLNVGCPSDRVQNGMIGAVLMGHAGLVRDGVAAMREATSLPVTVKHRIGIDDQDSYAFLTDFVGTVAEGGCETFIVHARKAFLQGLSPRENRDVPPLDYDRVYQLKRDFPHLEIIINGGIQRPDAAQHLPHVDGVMLGRAVWHQPMCLADVDQALFAEDQRAPLTAQQAAEAMLPYIERELAAGQRLHHVIKPLFNLFHQCPGARQYRRHLSEQAHRPDAGIDVFLAALQQVERAAERAPAAQAG